MALGPAVIQAGGALLGGLLGRTKPVSARQSFNSHMAGVMDSATKYGFSPLTLLNVASPGFSPGDNSTMGAGVADAAMFLGDALAKKTDAMKLQQVAQERDQLQKRVETLTLRPKVPGIYGAGGPSIRMGGPNAASPSLADPRLNDPVALDDGDRGGIAVPDGRLDRGSGSYAFGIRLESAPGWSPSQVIEDEYGDVASWGYGLAKIATDVGHNAGRWLAMSDYSPWQKPKYNKKFVPRDAYGRPLPTPTYPVGR